MLCKKGYVLSGSGPVRGCVRRDTSCPGPDRSVLCSIDPSIDRWIDRWMDRSMDRRMDRLIFGVIFETLGDHF